MRHKAPRILIKLICNDKRTPWGRPFVLCGLPIMDNQQPQPQLLSQPLFPQPPKPQPPQQTRMSTSIRIQVQLFPPKQLLHIKKTSFFCLHHILCRLLQMCYVLMRLSDLIPQLIICTLFQKQLLMRADFLDSVISENHYSVIILNGGKAMCNREGGAVMR